MDVIRLRKGHDIVLPGKPEKRLEVVGRPLRLKVRPSDFRGIRPRLLVRKGQHVSVGSPLFCSKDNPELTVASPGSGRVAEVVLGERRIIEEIVIELDRSEAFEQFEAFGQDALGSLSRERIREQLLRSGMWPVIRQRPFSSVADPASEPKAVFVSAMPTMPFAPETDYILSCDPSGLQAGLTLLAKLVGRPVHLVISAEASDSPLTEAKDTVVHRFSGPHPAGNVGIHIHHIAPVRGRGDIVWYVSLQDVMRIGRFFLQGRFPTGKIITVGGEPFEKKQYMSVRHGMMLGDILRGNAVASGARLISGDVLTGRAAGPEEPLGFYHEIVSAVAEKKGRDFFGWLSPGLRKYSASKLFLSRLNGNAKARLDTGVNGSRRVMIPFGNIESVLPMDIEPAWLIRMIIARDIDEMEKLGIYECDPEDFALCSFVDASKMEIAEIVREGLDFIEKNG
ncbi:NADH:ubiquinone reductase (Na(+)-transporting) subunit A [Prosthecochloris sp. GSB1]|uniref:Na(+)-translocating NADH-quinone reductase subunit A n=1 Tax=Prosthecochloris sp. GSB1 TaxID=281093 RepID=UPI000B8CFDF0|nr:Na(+)-translocating NADH-quinone reductase subunit A [Prosthecochloris sp. GSB1]ASQ91406.1 NADH:ubiquinone reductase (Na(+)-transporting) subunit A [Prosthecochloris sp. GSB1]